MRSNVNRSLRIKSSSSGLLASLSTLCNDAGSVQKFKGIQTSSRGSIGNEKVDQCSGMRQEAGISTVGNRWDEKAGLQRDALSSQLSTRLKRGRQGDRR
jgi:hypothetical protein